MESSRDLTKLEQPEPIKKLDLKLPFSLRVIRRSLVDKIMEDKERTIRCYDFADFADHEASSATNPLFGKIVEDSELRSNERRVPSNKGSYEKRKEGRSSASHLDNCLFPPSTNETPSSDSSVESPPKLQ